MTFLNHLRRALSAEIYKLRHSSIPVTTFMLPAAIVFTMNFVLPLATNGLPFGGLGNVWLSTTIGMLQMWILVRTFHVGVLTAQIAGLEHDNHTWKYLFALPVSRKAVFIAKIILAQGLFGMSMIVMLVSLVVSGLALNVFRPELGFGAGLPLGDMTAIMLISYAASWLMITLQAWAGLHWQRFGGPIGLASVAFLLTFGLASYPNITRIFPWSLPTNFIVTGFNLTGKLIDTDIAATSILISLVGSIAVIALSTWQLSRRDVL
jgi:hypothetical protein